MCTNFRRWGKVHTASHSRINLYSGKHFDEVFFPEFQFFLYIYAEIITAKSIRPFEYTFKIHVQNTLHVQKYTSKIHSYRLNTMRQIHQIHRTLFKIAFFVFYCSQIVFLHSADIDTCRKYIYLGQKM